MAHDSAFVAGIIDARHSASGAICAVEDRSRRVAISDGLANVGIPLNLVQKWLGHAQLTTTTAIYADAVGAEEKDIAKRVWG